MNIPFPFAISFKKNVEFNAFSNEQREKITKKLKFEAVEISSTSKELIEFDFSLFRFVSPWGSMIDHGQIELIRTKNGTQLEYKVSLIRFMIITVIMATIMGFTSDSFSVFIVFLTFLLGLNWIIAWVRQKFYFDSLIKEIKNDAPTKSIRNVC